MTPKQRDRLQDDFIHQIVDDMDLKTLCEFACDVLSQEYDQYTTEELKTQVKEFYPELLKDEQESQRH